MTHDGIGPDGAASCAVSDRRRAVTGGELTCGPVRCQASSSRRDGRRRRQEPASARSRRRRRSSCRNHSAASPDLRRLVRRATRGPVVVRGPTRTDRSGSARPARPLVRDRCDRAWALRAALRTAPPVGGPWRLDDGGLVGLSGGTGAGGPTPPPPSPGGGARRPERARLRPAWRRRRWLRRAPQLRIVTADLGRLALVLVDGIGRRGVPAIAAGGRPRRMYLSVRTARERLAGRVALRGGRACAHALTYEGGIGRDRRRRSTLVRDGTPAWRRLEFRTGSLARIPDGSDTDDDATTGVHDLAITEPWGDGHPKCAG